MLPQLPLARRGRVARGEARAARLIRASLQTREGARESFSKPYTSTWSSFAPANFAFIERIQTNVGRMIKHARTSGSIK